MTPTEKARRSDALHQGPDTRRVLCDMIANRESDLEELRAENAKLRELVKSMYYDLTNMTFPPDWVTDYAADMRDLGVEVG